MLGVLLASPTCNQETSQQNTFTKANPAIRDQKARNRTVFHNDSAAETTIWAHSNTLHTQFCIHSFIHS